MQVLSLTTLLTRGSGTTAGDSAGSNTGTLTNGPTWASGTDAKVGTGAMSFDGVDDYVYRTYAKIISEPVFKP